VDHLLVRQKAHPATCSIQRSAAAAWRLLGPTLRYLLIQALHPRHSRRVANLHLHRSVNASNQSRGKVVKYRGTPPRTAPRVPQHPTAPMTSHGKPFARRSSLLSLLLNQEFPFHQLWERRNGMRQGDLQWSLLFDEAA
jgi:hypothetical protein